MTDTLHQEPERDQFKSESPIRAFTNWTVQGRYALGKGFRPSLAHVIPYLNAMETKEGWQIVQVLEADTQTPSFLFRQSYVVPDDVLIERLRGDEVLKQQVRDLLCPVMPEIAERTYEVRGKITLHDVDAFLKDQGLVLAACPDGVFRMYKAESDRPETYAMEYFTRDQDGNVSMTRAAFDDMPDWVTEALPNFGIEPPYIRNREGFEEAATKIDAMRERAEADFSDDVDPASRDPIYSEACKLIGRGWTEKASMRDLEGHSKFCNSRATGFFKDCSCAYQRPVGKAPELGMPYSGFPAACKHEGKTSTATMGDGVEVTMCLECGTNFEIDGKPIPPVEAIGGDDPINPKHYGGTACAEIGELLSANSYQVLKYNWRLGEKDNPCIEIGKSIWYLEREIALIHEGHTFIPGDERLPDHTFFDLRLQGRSEHTVKVARSLISWNRYGNPETLKLLLRVLQNKLDSFNGCEDWDRGRGFAI